MSARHIQPPPGPGRSRRLCSVPSRQGLHPGGADSAGRRVLPRVSVLDVSMAGLWDGSSESPHTPVESQTLGFRRGSPSICPLGVLGGLSVTSAQATSGALGLSVFRGGWVQGVRGARLRRQSPTAGLWAWWALTVTLWASALHGGTNPFAAVGPCAPWAPPVTMAPGPPARLGLSAGPATSLACRSARPAPRDWPVLRVSGEVAKLPPCPG